MSCGIYKITSPTGKIYIEQSTNIEGRFKYYYRLECKGQIKLISSLKKYGPETHKFEIIEQCSVDQLNEREIYWGQFYNVLDPKVGLNLKELGVGGKWNDEMKVKFKKLRNTTEWKSFISSIHKNKIVSQKTRDKISLSIKGTKQSKDTIIKRNLFGKKSPETIDKMKKSKSNVSRPIICLSLNKKFTSIREAAKFLKIDQSGINKVLKNKSKTCKGLKFKYLEK